MLLHAFLVIFLLVPSLLEGLGLRADRQIFLLFFSISSTFLYIYSSFSPKRIIIPLKAGMSYFLFLFFIVISTFFSSVDKQISFELFLLYYSSFLLFIFFYNNKVTTGRFVHYFPIILGVFYTCYSFLLPFLRQKGLTFLLPVIEKQFIFASFGGHNHLGDFLGLLVIVLTHYCFQKKWIYFPFCLLFFFILIFSFSRSAYIALFVVFILMLFYERKKISSYFLPILFLFLAFIIISTFLISIQLPPSSPYYKLQTYGKTLLKIAPRNIFSSHEIFAKQATVSIRKHPFFGIGGGNFVIASQNNMIDNIYSDSAHNIFLELTTEQGVLATAFFLLFVLLILKHILSFPSFPGFLFLYLLINFQTDYTYQIYSFFLFWIILSSFAYTEKRNITISTSIYGLLCMIPLIILVCITTSALFMKKNDYKNAIRWYPLNKEAYINVIQQSDIQTPAYIKNAEYIAPYDYDIIAISGDYFLRQGNKKVALFYYEKVYLMNKLCPFDFIKKIYTLKKEVRSQQEADIFIKDTIQAYQNIFATNYLRKEFTNFCKDAHLASCPKIGWND